MMTTGITEIGIAEDVKMTVESRCAALWVSGLNACANVAGMTTIVTVEIGIAEDVEMIVENRCAGNGRSV
jgi:hypothetical protein